MITLQHRIWWTKEVMIVPIHRKFCNTIFLLWLLDELSFKDLFKRNQCFIPLGITLEHKWSTWLFQKVLLFFFLFFFFSVLSCKNSCCRKPQVSLCMSVQQKNNAAWCFVRNWTRRFKEVDLVVGLKVLWQKSCCKN